MQPVHERVVLTDQTDTLFLIQAAELTEREKSRNTLTTRKI